MKRRVQDSILKSLQNDISSLRSDLESLLKRIQHSEFNVAKNLERVGLIQRDAIDAFSMHAIRNAAIKIKKKRRITFIGTGNLHENTVIVCKKLIELKSVSNYDIVYIAFSDAEERFFRKINFKVDRWEYQPELAIKIMESKIVVLNSHLFALPGSCLLSAFCSASIKVQLWHGLPAKAIGFESAYYTHDIHFTAALLDDTLSYDFLTVQTEDAVSISTYAKAFPNAKIFVTGDPRLDVLFDNNYASLADSFKSYLFLTKDKKRILIAPTYYDTHKLHQEMINKLKSFINLLLENNFSVCLRFHPFGKVNYSDLHDDNYFENLSPDFYYFNDLDDNIYQYFNYIDAIVTDWSSIRFDFSALNKPIILWRPIVNRRAEEVSVYSLLDKASLLLETENENSDQISSILHYLETDSDAVVRKSLFDKYNTYQDGKSANRVAQLIEQLVLENITK